MSDKKRTENGTDFACQVAAFGAIRRAMTIIREEERSARIRLPSGAYVEMTSRAIATDIARAAIRAALKAHA